MIRVRFCTDGDIVLVANRQHTVHICTGIPSYFRKGKKAAPLLSLIGTGELQAIAALYRCTRASLIGGLSASLTVIKQQRAIKELVAYAVRQFSKR